ncbi:TonB-dependent receptor [Pseudomonas marginalis]|uniref:TonB-dependent receptor n=1 Tax=Pseudomonas marginalis TaxID=298 RepID=A0A9X9BMH6_PSEMA|nr:TonB-dependent receptor [Pseudomonas marginalis]TWR51754.1 TonB-dependent receptor [Pseudomonas marginalis]SEB47867.1 pesticin/yersiniabactin receptor [Pseudomonas marginalis]
MQRSLLHLAVLFAITPYASADSVLTLPELQVTASKRVQSQNQTDLALAVATPADLEQANVYRSGELERVFPELLVRNTGAGLFPSLSMRGISSSDPYNAPVGIYVDGVPQYLGTFNQELLDIEQIELLKGPQGTLYGRNAHAGALNITTRQPDETQTATVQSRFSNLHQQVSASGSAPLVSDRLYVQGAVYHDDTDGELTRSEHHGDSDNGGGRVGLLFKANEDLSLRLAYARDKLRSYDEQYLADETYGKRRASVPLMESVYVRRVESSSATVDWSLNDSWRLTSISALQNYRHERLFGDLGFLWPETQRTLSQELRLSTQGADRAWDLVTGLYWQNSKSHSQREPDASAPLSGVYGQADSRIENTEKAVFGEFTWHLAPRWDLTLGARHSQEKAETRYVQQNALFTPGFEYSGNDTFTSTTPKVALGFQATPDTRLYASVSKGFKAGGYNRIGAITPDAVAYSPEKSLNMEVGIKASLLDKRVWLNGALYRIYIDDVQQFVGDAGTGTQSLANIGKARSEGAELSVDWQATEATRLSIAGTLNRNRLLDSERQGNQLTFTPKRTLRVSAEHSLYFDGVMGEVRPSVGLSYTGKHYFDVDNQVAQSGYSLLDARLAWLPRPDLELALYGNNLSDKLYRTYAYESAGQQFAQPGHSRELGLSMKASF